jgi:hypothetical protein
MLKIVAFIITEVGIDEFDEEFSEDNIESDETNPWYVDAVKRLVELKEEAEDDLICNVGYDSNNLNKNMTNTIYEGNFEVLE